MTPSIRGRATRPIIARIGAAGHKKVRWLAREGVLRVPGSGPPGTTTVPTHPFPGGPALPPHEHWERALRAGGFRHVAGVDEAGRGPLAGPVAAAAVVLDPGAVPPGLDDSKALSAARREALFEAILASALAVGVGLAPAAEIDAVNIRQATFAAMRRAVRALAVPPDHLLVDGRDVPPGLPGPARALIKGDALSVSVAAASIVAKVVRDRLMERLDALHPAYGFRVHKGYPTAAHRAALLRHGPTPFHRLSFKPLAPGTGR